MDAAFQIPGSNNGKSSSLVYPFHSFSNSKVQISWGVVLCCHAALKNRQGLYVVRAFLGLLEAGMWPGTMLHVTYWYRPDEIAPRVVLITLLGNFSSVISGLLAFAFNGVTAGGLSGWKW
jgi:MFS family permease